MNSCKKVNLCVKRTDIVDSASVNSLVLVLKPSANNVLLNEIHNLVELCSVILKSLIKLLVNCFINRKKRCVTNCFIVCIKSLLNVLDAELFNLCHNLRIGIGAFIFKLRLANLGNNTVYEFNNLLVFFMSSLDSTQHCIVVNLVCACFNHSNKVCS